SRFPVVREQRRGLREDVLLVSNERRFLHDARDRPRRLHRHYRTDQEILMRKLLLMLLLLLPGAVLAADVETLKTLLNQTTTARARFAQVVLDKNRKTLQQATGTMEFQRPGRFRWEYNKPYEQTIVGDGQKLWIYDKDLNQVT